MGIYRKSLGPRHAKVAVVLDNRATLLMKIGRNSERKFVSAVWQYSRIELVQKAPGSPRSMNYATYCSTCNHKPNQEARKTCDTNQTRDPGNRIADMTIQATSLSETKKKRRTDALLHIPNAMKGIQTQSLQFLCSGNLHGP